MKYLVIGDVHGKVAEYSHILKSNKYDVSIQIGDFGLKNAHNWFLDNIHSSKDHVLFGNHDWYPNLEQSYSLGNYTVLESSIMCIRGAHSIDRHHRIEGLDWFSNEQLGYRESLDVIAKYESIKPSVVISHECPQTIRSKYFDIPDSNSTAMMLDQCLDIHAPGLWIFGHHHRDFKYFTGTTFFICLDELQTHSFEI